jgi:hypothetical protein
MYRPTYGGGGGGGRVGDRPPDEVGASIAPEDSTAEVADDLTRRAQPGLVSPSSPTNDLHKLVNKEGGVNRAGLLPKRSNSLGSLRAFE